MWILLMEVCGESKINIKLLDNYFNAQIIFKLAELKHLIILCQVVIFIIFISSLSTLWIDVVKLWLN